MRTSDDGDDLNMPWATIVLVCLAIGLAVFVLNAIGYINLKTWGPKHEEVRREIFENSPSFIHGKQQYLVRLYGEWSTASAAHRDALCAVARNEALSIKPQDIPVALKTWECTN